MEKAKGIDVSHWQGRIDFDKVKSQGYSFVMINAGYGKYIRMPGTAKFVAEKGVFEITGPDGDVLTINTTWD